MFHRRSHSIFLLISLAFAAEAVNAQGGGLVLRLMPHAKTAQVGEVFDLHLWLDNPRHREFNVVCVGLTYDPWVLEWVDAPGGEEDTPHAHDGSGPVLERFPFVRDNGADPFYLNVCDTETGEVFYRARCVPGETCTSEGIVFSMKFRALAPTSRVPIRIDFSDWPEEIQSMVFSEPTWEWPSTRTFVGLGPTAERRAWIDLLGSPAKSRDGVISGEVSVPSADQDLPRGGFLQGEEDTGTRIVLEPRNTGVQSGQWFDLRVLLRNPNEVSWDRIRLEVLFDPGFLEVVDRDEGNWLRRGVNILEAQDRSLFPFDWRFANEVRPKEGRILFDCARFRSPLRSGGVVATIRFLALRPTGETIVQVVTPSQTFSTGKGTLLTSRGNDVLGNFREPGDGVLGAAVSIVPELRSERIAAVDRGLNR